MTPAVQLDFGGRYANYGYLEDQGLLSPRAGIERQAARRRSADSCAPACRTARARRAPRSSSRRPLACGCRPSARSRRCRARRRSGPSASITSRWRPSARWPAPSLVGVRAFRQRGEDQIVTLFGVDRRRTRSPTAGHYRVGSAGDFDATGWGVSVSRTVGRRHARVGGLHAGRRRVERPLAATSGRWRAWPPGAAPLRHRARPDGHGRERGAGDVHARVRALQAQYRGVGPDGFEQASAGGARFDVQVNQALPFSVARSRWEVLVAVKNVFHDEFDSGSIYDELLVVRAPTRVLGGHRQVLGEIHGAGVFGFRGRHVAR